jgi:hypothetical protein
LSRPENAPVDVLSGKHKIVEKNFDSFFGYLVLSGNLGKQSLRFRAAKTFFFGITFFLYQNENPVLHLEHWRQFYASLILVLAII